MEFFHKVTTFPFMHTRRIWYVVSAFAIIASIVLLFVRPLNLGVDFTGGVVMEFSFPQPADAEKTRAALHEAGFVEPHVQQVGTHEMRVTLRPQAELDTNQVAENVQAALEKTDANVKLRSSETVGPQVGKELTDQGGMAVLFTFILIGIYTWFRFQWKMGVSAVVATLHDPIIILGFFSLMQIPVDLSVLAAVLAVIGYSLNDTVVVFDRVRENFHGMRGMTSEQVLDASVNQTLSRTIITSGATLLVVIVLLLFGGETLRGFSWALTVGIVVGTYSSIYVAGALALELKLSAIDLMPVHKEDAELDRMP
jgi:preprotein translocase subunit SecF